MQDQLINAVHVVTRKLASSGNYDLLLKDVLAICIEAVGASGGTIYLHDAPSHRLKFQHVLPEDVREKLPVLDIPDDFGAAGQAFQTRKTFRKDFPHKDPVDWNEFEKATGVQVSSIVATPLMMEDEEPIGVVQLLNKEDGSFSDTDCAVLDTVSAVATMAYFNYQLTENAARASTLLGMGKVSHDIGNLAASLYATLNFSEVTVHKLRELFEEDSLEAIAESHIVSLESMYEDLRDSVDRIVRYARLVSDMSAGRQLRPVMTTGPLAPTIQTAAAFLASQARESGVALTFDVREDCPLTVHDELYIFRIVQNLVGNAIKAVQETIPSNYESNPDEEFPETFGEVNVNYHFDRGNHVIEVRDTGSGMSSEIADRLLRGTARSMWDKGTGSGWGMKIVMELAATHDAQVSIDSEVGSGSTFRVCIPHAEAVGNATE